MPKVLGWLRASGPFVLVPGPTPVAPLPGSGVVRPPPRMSPDTHCLPAGVRALPETGSRGGSGLPLRTCGSWIHTERHNGATGPWLGDCRDPSGQSHPYRKLGGHVERDLSRSSEAPGSGACSHPKAVSGLGLLLKGDLERGTEMQMLKQP